LLAADEIFGVLRNGEWHELKEVSSRTRLQEFKVELITNFLAEYNFLKLDKKNRKVKLSPQLLRFLKRIEDVEREPIVEQKKRELGTIVL